MKIIHLESDFLKKRMSAPGFDFIDYDDVLDTIMASYTSQLNGEVVKERMTWKEYEKLCLEPDRLPEKKRLLKRSVELKKRRTGKQYTT